MLARRLVFSVLGLLSLFFLVSSFTLLVYAAAAWTDVGAPGFTPAASNYTALAMDNGTPYVAFLDSNQSGKMTVMKFDGTTWVTVGAPGFSAGSAFFTSLALDDGTPYVAYQDQVNSAKATVMKFDGTNWVAVGSAGFSAGTASYTSVAVDNGTPYVGYVDGGNSNKATVMKFDGTDWVAAGSAGFSAGSVYYTVLALDGSTPYLAFQDNTNSFKATVMKFDGTNWVAVGSAGFSAGLAGELSLALDGSTPYLAYQDAANSSKATAMKFDGTNWVDVGTAGFSAGMAFYTSLALDGSTPYVAYQDGGNSSRATVMKFDGTNWVDVGTAGFSAGMAFYTSLALDGSTPYVGYRDGGASNHATVMVLDDTQPGPNFVVTKSADTNGTCTVVFCSLREAITAANALAGTDTITFDIPPGDSGCTAANVCTITLGSALPALSDNVTIDGSFNAADITIDGDSLYRPLAINSGKTVTLDTLTIANGKMNGLGGGVFNKGTLNVNRSTFSGNSGSHGAGIYSDATLNVTNSTFSGNAATALGGGIYNEGGMMVVNSTFSGNSATASGGGLFQAGSGSISNSTISGNSVNSVGGGIGTSNSASLSLYNTIVANNPNGGDCFLDTLAVLDADPYNLDSDQSCGGATTKSLFELSLQALAENGGPTQTIALSNSSYAIDTGDNSVCDDNPGPNGLDQRGEARDDLNCDVGAFEFVESDGTTILKRNFVFGPLYTFGPTLAGVTSGGPFPDTLEISRALTPPVNSPPANALPITWDALTKGSQFSFLFTLCYDPSVLTGQTESLLRVWHYNGSTWDDLGGTLDTVTHAPLHCVTATTALTSLSPLILAPGTPTAANIAGPRAALNQKGNVVVRWRTLNESFVAGFNVYRRVGKGAWNQVNAEFLAAKNSGDATGNKYRRIDKKLKPGKTHRYRIQVIYTDNHSEWTEVVKFKAGKAP